MTRTRPETITLRVTQGEKAMVKAVAETQGMLVSELARELIVPAVRRRLARQEEPAEEGEE